MSSAPQPCTPEGAALRDVVNYLAACGPDEVAAILRAVSAHTAIPEPASAVGEPADGGCRSPHFNLDDLVKVVNVREEVYHARDMLMAGFRVVAVRCGYGARVSERHPGSREWVYDLQEIKPFVGTYARGRFYRGLKEAWLRPYHPASAEERPSCGAGIRGSAAANDGSDDGSY